MSVGGSSLPAVRVELNPEVLNKYGIGVEEVRAAIAAANANRPKGSLEDGDRHWQIHANDQAKTAAEYLPLIVAYRNGAPCSLPTSATWSTPCRTCATPAWPTASRRSSSSSTASRTRTSSRRSTA